MIMRETSALPVSRIPRPVAMGLTALGVLLIAGTLLMWMHYGTAVFYEIIVAGISMCL
jgi:hypothetical protein